MWVRRLIVSFYLAGSVSRELFSFLSLTRADKHGHFRMRTSGFCWGIRRPLGTPPIRCGPRPRALINASWMPGWRLLRTGTIIFPEQLVRSIRQDAPSACFCGMFVTVGQECLKSSRLSSDRAVRNLSPFQLWFSFRDHRLANQAFPKDLSIEDTSRQVSERPSKRRPLSVKRAAIAFTSTSTCSTCRARSVVLLTAAFCASISR